MRAFEGGWSDLIAGLCVSVDVDSPDIIVGLRSWVAALSRVLAAEERAKWMERMLPRLLDPNQDTRIRHWRLITDALCDELYRLNRADEVAYVRLGQLAGGFHQLKVRPPRDELDEPDIRIDYNSRVLRELDVPVSDEQLLMRMLEDPGWDTPKKAFWALRNQGIIGP